MDPKDANAGLTPEEIEAMNAEVDDENRPFEVVEGEADAEQAQSKAEPQDEAEDGEDETPAPAAIKTTDDPAPKAAPVVQNTIVPVLRDPAPVDLKAKLADIEAKQAALDAQFDEGDIDGAAYRKQTAALADEKLDLRLVAERSSIAREMREQQQAANWQASISQFLADHPEINKTSPHVMKALDGFVVAAEEANEVEKTGLTDRQILDKAYAAYRAEFMPGVKLVGKAAADAEARRKSGEAMRERVPKTLADVPSADGGDLEDSDFAALDKLINGKDPEAAEAAMRDFERRSPARFNEYMKRA